MHFRVCRRGRSRRKYICRQWASVLKIIQKWRPVKRQAMLLKVAKWERESVIDADDRGRAGAKLCHKPFSYLATGPIPAGAFWGSDLAGRREPVTLIYTQTLEAGCRYFSARVINADVTVEDHCSVNFRVWFKDKLEQTGLYHSSRTFTNDGPDGFSKKHNWQLQYCPYS